MRSRCAIHYAPRAPTHHSCTVAARTARAPSTPPKKSPAVAHRLCVPIHPAQKLFVPLCVKNTRFIPYRHYALAARPRLPPCPIATRPIAMRSRRGRARCPHRAAAPPARCEAWHPTRLSGLPTPTRPFKKTRAAEQVDRTKRKNTGNLLDSLRTRIRRNRKLRRSWQ